MRQPGPEGRSSMWRLLYRPLTGTREAQSVGISRARWVT